MGMTTAESLLTNIPALLAEELFTPLLQSGNLRIERIVSQGQASPPGFWYDQDENEWVLLIQGSAAVEFAGWPQPIPLRAGMYLNIPAHAKHRIAWTDPQEKTVWLAVHYR